MKNKPDIRFDGFNDAWELRKLSKIYSKINNAFVGTATPYYVDKNTGFFYLESNNVKDGQINRNSEVYINEEFYYQQRDKWLKTGDIVMVQSGHVGHTAVIPDDLNDSAAHALIMFRGAIEDINPYFVNYQFQTHVAKRKLETITTGNTIKHILASEMKEFIICMPTGAEQNRIGIFFQTLDNLITLHQRELENYKLLKKGFLQKLFPSNDVTNPSIRFDGFTDAWELCRLGDVVERVTRKNQSLLSKLPLTISAQDGLIDQNKYFNKTIASKDVSGYYLIKNGEFAYNKSYSNGYPWGAIKRLDYYEMGVLSTLYIIFKPVKINSEFLAKYYDTTYWHKEVSKHAAEGARNHGLLNIAASDFFQTELMIPTNEEEQQQIGVFFSKLDELITLHQRELDNYKELKKGFLQKMFV